MKKNFENKRVQNIDKVKQKNKKIFKNIISKECSPNLKSNSISLKSNKKKKYNLIGLFENFRKSVNNQKKNIEKFYKRYSQNDKNKRGDFKIKQKSISKNNKVKILNKNYDPFLFKNGLHKKKLIFSKKCQKNIKKAKLITKNYLKNIDKENCVKNDSENILNTYFQKLSNIFKNQKLSEKNFLYSFKKNFEKLKKTKKNLLSKLFLQIAKIDDKSFKKINFFQNLLDIPSIQLKIYFENISSCLYNEYFSFYHNNRIFNNRIPKRFQKKNIKKLKFTRTFQPKKNRSSLSIQLHSTEAFKPINKYTNLENFFHKQKQNLAEKSFQNFDFDIFLMKELFNKKLEKSFFNKKKIKSTYSRSPKIAVRNSNNSSFNKKLFMYSFKDSITIGEKTNTDNLENKYEICELNSKSLKNLSQFFELSNSNKSQLLTPQNFIFKKIFEKNNTCSNFLKGKKSFFNKSGNTLISKKNNDQKQKNKTLIKFSTNLKEICDKNQDKINDFNNFTTYTNPQKRKTAELDKKVNKLDFFFKMKNTDNFSPNIYSKDDFSFIQNSKPEIYIEDIMSSHVYSNKSLMSNSQKNDVLQVSQFEKNQKKNINVDIQNQYLSFEKNNCFVNENKIHTFGKKKESNSKTIFVNHISSKKKSENKESELIFEISDQSSNENLEKPKELIENNLSNWIQIKNIPNKIKLKIDLKKSTFDLKNNLKKRSLSKLEKKLRKCSIREKKQKELGIKKISNFSKKILTKRFKVHLNLLNKTITPKS